MFVCRERREEVEGAYCIEQRGEREWAGVPIRPRVNSKLLQLFMLPWQWPPMTWPSVPRQTCWDQVCWYSCLSCCRRAGQGHSESCCTPVARTRSTSKIHCSMGSPLHSLCLPVWTFPVIFSSLWWSLSIYSNLQYSLVGNLLVQIYHQSNFCSLNLSVSWSTNTCVVNTGACAFIGLGWGVKLASYVLVVLSYKSFSHCLLAGPCNYHLNLNINYASNAGCFFTVSNKHNWTPEVLLQIVTR